MKDAVTRHIRAKESAWVDYRLQDQLIQAAKRIIASLDQVLEDHELWRNLRGEKGLGELRFAPDRALQIQEIVSHNVPAFLTALGYQPPRQRNWTEWAQRALERAIELTLGQFDELRPGGSHSMG